MTETVTWLHISDVHLCKEEHNFESSEIFETFFDDLNYMKNKGLYPDLIFFTGDLVLGRLPKISEQTYKNQFTEAKDFFKRIQDVFIDLPKDNIFIVPGNHDINRKQVSESQISYLEKFRKDKSDNVQKKINALIKNNDVEWQRFIERLDYYKNFLKESDYNHLLEDPERMIYSTTREINGFKVGIAGLNSVWSSCCDDEKGKLWFGTYQILEAYNNLKGVNISVALAHHPPNWFTEFEDKTIAGIIDKNFNFFLHGHEHQEWVTHPYNSKNVCIAAGALYNTSNLKYGYNFVKLDPIKNKGEVFLRTYKENQWIHNYIPNKTNTEGVWRLKSLKFDFKKIDCNEINGSFEKIEPSQNNSQETHNVILSELNNLDSYEWDAKNLLKIIRDDILNNKDKLNILVLGDVMLDSTMYMIDKDFDQVNDHNNLISRISVLLTEDTLINNLKITSSDRRSLGGAAGIVTALLEIPKIHVDMVGIIGEDREGNEIRELFRDLKNCAHSKFHPIVIDKYPTVTKYYFQHVDRHHQGNQKPIVYRYDREDRLLINNQIDEYKNNFSMTLKKIEKIADKVDTKYDCIIINDYEKGMLNSYVIKWIQNMKAKYKDTLIFVDPKYKFKCYKDITISAMIPNIKEASMGIREIAEIEEKYTSQRGSESELDDKGYTVLKSYLNKCDSFIIKANKKGAVIYSKDNNYSKIKVPPFPISEEPQKSCNGCGDTFDAYFILGQLKKLPLQTSVNLACIASGIKRKKELGEVVKPREIEKELIEFMNRRTEVH